jgi:hypothetical protein
MELVRGFGAFASGYIAAERAKTGCGPRAKPKVSRVRS